MSTVHHSHVLNLYSPDDSKRFRILPESAKTVLSGDGCPIEIDTILSLPTQPDVAAALGIAQLKLTAIESDLLTNAATASSASNTVHVALNTYKAANDAALAVEKARVDAILSGASVDLDTLSELVSAYEAADTTITSQLTSQGAAIAGLTASVAALSAQLAALTAA